MAYRSGLRIEVHPKSSEFIIFAALAIVLAFMETEPAAAQTLPKFDSKVAGQKFSRPKPAPNATFAAGSWMADLNGDGREELVVPFNNYPGMGPDVPEPIEVLEANSRTFAYAVATSRIVTGIRPEFVHSRVFAEGDFNGDGRTDLFIGGHGYDTHPFAGETDRILLSSTTRRQLGIIAPPAQKTYTHATASGDINRDGIADIYVGTLGGAVGPYFLLGRAGAAPTIADTLLPAAVADTVHAYCGAALTDVDGANGVDLVLGNCGGSDNVIYLNDGAGSFVKPSPDIVLPSGLFGRNTTITVDIAVADVNTDGRPDLLLSQTDYSSFYKGFGLQLLINTGAGFADETSARLPSGFARNGLWAERVLVADFFGDGLADIVLSGQPGATNQTRVIWLNDGNGVFQPQSRSFFDRNEKTDGNLIFPTDVNRDRRSDLVRIVEVDWTPVTRTHQVWTYINKGPATTAKPAAPVITRQPAAVTIDRNTPLLLSVAATGQRPLAYQWFRNNIAIKGATSPAYYVPVASVADAGRYTVKVNSGKATAKSLPVNVVVR
jgi:hypothetical protein